MTRPSDAEIVEVLRRLGRELSADYVEGEDSFWGGVHSHGTVRAKVGPWTITVCIFTTRGRHIRTLTEVHVPFLNPAGFRFWITPAGFLGNLFKKLRLVRDVEVGFHEFDEAFIISGDDQGVLHDLFADSKFRLLILEQPQFSMSVKDEPWPFAIGKKPYFPATVDVLYFQATEPILDVEQLKGVFDVFAATLERLSQLGLAVREPPGVEIPGILGLAHTLTGPESESSHAVAAETPAFREPFPPPNPPVKPGPKSPFLKKLPIYLAGSKLKPPTVAPGSNDSDSVRQWLDRERQAASAPFETQTAGRPVWSAVRWGCLLVSAAVALVMGGLLLVFVLGFQLPNWRANNRYLPTSCVVLDKKLTPVTNPGAGKDDPTGYDPQIKIRYEVGGRRYEVWTYEAVKVLSADRAAQQAVVDGFRVGTTVPCWYDPARPDQAVLVRRPHWEFLLIPVCPMTLVLLLGVVGLRLAWKMRVPASASLN